MKSMKPSGRTVDDEPKVFHHVTGLLAQPLAVKKEVGKGLLLLGKQWLLGGKLHYRLATPSSSRSAQGSARCPGTWGEICRQPGGRA